MPLEVDSPSAARQMTSRTCPRMNMYGQEALEQWRRLTAIGERALLRETARSAHWGKFRMQLWVIKTASLYDVIRENRRPGCIFSPPPLTTESPTTHNCPTPSQQTSVRRADAAQFYTIYANVSLRGPRTVHFPPSASDATRVEAHHAGTRGSCSR